MHVLVRERLALHRSLAILGAVALTAALISGLLTVAPARPAAAATTAGTYDNPLRPVVPGDGIVESCADPSTIYDPASRFWYTYCTADPLNDEDRTAEGFNFRLIPILRSRDLIRWTYVGDAFEERPAYAAAGAGIWAPEIEYYPDSPAAERWHLYYTVTETTLAGGGSAIGVATAPTPEGPWTHSAEPAVEPHPADCCPGSRRWVFDPEVLRTDGPDYMYYGSYFGGISVRVLSEDGFDTDAATQTNVAIANKYEGAEVIFRAPYYYLFVSATDCCRGPLTGYSVYVGRSTSPTGPFLDRSGVSLNDDERMDDPTDGRAGGTPVITMNGDRWVGTGHNTVFQDFAGQWWTIYHAIDRTDPYFQGGVDLFPGNCSAEGRPDDFHGAAVPQTEPGGDGRDDRTGVPCGDLNKRPALLDAIDWVGGWPIVRGGFFASDTPQHGPAAQPGWKTNYRTRLERADIAGVQITRLSDEFNNGTLSPQWRWVRQPRNGYGEGGGVFRFDTQAADLFTTSNTASVLTEAAPHGNYVVETRVRLNVPAEGCCFNYVQAGLVIYGNDDDFLKLVHVSIWNTRQTEWAKELAPVPLGYPRYGNTVVGPPAEWTFLRIVKRTQGDQGGADLYGGREEYTAYTSRDANNDGRPDLWEKGGTWSHSLGKSARIGLVSMGGSGFRAEFDYVRVYRLHR